MDYTYLDKEVTIDLLTNLDDLSEEMITRFSQDWNVQYEDHRLRDNSLRVYYKNNTLLDVDIKTGKGNLEYKRKVPIVGHTMVLHKSTNNFWIWYSDIFGIAMMVIAGTGVFIPVGKNGLKAEGGSLRLQGCCFPCCFYFFFKAHLETYSTKETNHITSAL